MNLAKVGILFTKEIRQGASNFFFVYALIMPVILSLLVTVVFGDLFNESPRLGIYDAGASGVTATLTAESHLLTTLYPDEASLREAVERGAETAGLLLPAGFDSALVAGESPDLTLIYWSESLAKNITIINSAVDQALTQIVAIEPTITLESIRLGDAAEPINWTERLLPLVVLMTIILGGVLVPASSLVDEKQKRTLSALTVTPASLFDVYIAKALLGISISILMGLIVLVLNNAFGGQPALLISVMALAAVASAVFGVLLGSLVKDINVLLAVIKTGGLVLFAPAIIQLVPSIPQWIAQVFPTYYMLNPVIEVSQNNAGLGEIAGDMAVLLAIIGAMVVLLVLIMERQQKQLAAG